jgi:DNA-directed RNA polymerase subunit M/transcription elongation factor TFIIS
MRTITPPPISTYCQKCGGELRLKKIAVVDTVIDLDMEVLICSNCGYEQSLKLIHEPKTPHTGNPR